MTRRTDDEMRALAARRRKARTPDELRELEHLLRAARPRLITRVNPDLKDRTRYMLSSHIREGEPAGDEIIDEGFDPYHSPLGCPVYWRVIVRHGREFYCSTLQVTREQILKAWGTEGLAYCDPLTGTAIACIETVLRKKNITELKDKLQ
jgi:hypothetical protein